MVARGSCDRHLCRKRLPEELFYGRKRLLGPAFMSQEPLFYGRGVPIDLFSDEGKDMVDP